jgi:hypothetical protein
LTVNVSGPLVTATNLQASTTSTAIGDPVTLTATLTPASTTGSVSFYNGSTVIGTASVNAGVATLNTTFAASGTVALKAVFAGNSSWETSTSNSVSLFVTGNTADTVVLQSNPSSLIIGYTATLTASITPSAATGMVSFYSGSVLLGTAPVKSGVATLQNTFMSAGTQSLTAAYTGDTTYLASTSTPYTLTVSSPGSTPSNTALNLSESSGYAGDYVTLTATVTPLAATGQVDFYDNGTLLGSAVLANGKAAWAQAFNTIGDNDLTAVYQGDTTYNTSTSSTIDLVLYEDDSDTYACTDPTTCP